MSDITQVEVKLSVIIPCLNAANTIAVQLEALANQQWSEPWEVIISDNGSTDETLTIVEEYKKRLPRLRVVDAFDRPGPSYARNVGALAASGDLLAFCDADDEVAPGWVAAMGKALSRYDFVASSLEWEKFNPPWTLVGGKPQHDGVVVYHNYLPAASAWGLGIKRSIHEAIGGFDESMLRLGDVDYCWRAQLAGVKLHSVPDAVVHYRYPKELGDIYRKACLDGEYEILLFKKYRLLGMPKVTLQADSSRLKRLVMSLPQIRHKEKRNTWLWEFGYSIGRLQGRIKYRILLL